MRRRQPPAPPKRDRGRRLRGFAVPIPRVLPVAAGGCLEPVSQHGSPIEVDLSPCGGRAHGGQGPQSQFGTPRVELSTSGRFTGRAAAHDEQPPNEAAPPGGIGCNSTV